MINKKEIFVNDSVYGENFINEPIVIELINSREMNRLKNISQYGMPDEYYHKKNFSRYDHSLGVYFLLKKLGANLEEQIAGLLHDISHTAFSHVVDWVFGDPNKENFQDINHFNFILNSGLDNILNKYGYNTKRISSFEIFGLLDREIPSLCADRIDYCLRELKMGGSNTNFYVSNLTNNDGQIVFNNFEAASNFGLEFLKLQKEHWGGIEAKLRYFILSNILKRALEEEIIFKEDFYTIDYEIIKKLVKSNNNYIIDNLNLLRDRFFVKNSENGSGILLKKKFRYIDPEILFANKIRKLSEISSEYKEILEEEKKVSTIEEKVVYGGIYG